MKWPWWLTWWRKKRVGLALSGGAARGLSHLGVIKVLQSCGIRPVAISGTSAGALIGALTAADVPVDTMIETAKKSRWTQFTRPVRPSQMGLFTLEPMESQLQKLLGNIRNIEDLPIPFACMATDIERDEAVLLDHGPLTPAIRASCSVPGVFAPVQLNGRLLVDGGVTNNLPVKVLFEMGANYVIAVDLLPARGGPCRPRSLFEVTMTTFYNMVRVASRESAHAHLVIVPDIRDFGFICFNQRDGLIEKGRESAERSFPQLARDLRLYSRLSRQPKLLTAGEYP